MKYCILGSSGMLGRALYKECLKRNIDTVGIARKNADYNIDITNEKEIKEFLCKNRFDVVINTVAIVNHNICDEHPDISYMVNARPSSYLASLGDEIGYKYVYISTDGYFHGDGNSKHDEKAKPVFLNEYAKTKYIGEIFSLNSDKSLVVRTNIVGFKNEEQQTFVEWALSSIKNKEKMTLFEDYYTSSIPVSLFSSILLDLISKNACGLYNLASSEVFSKKDFILNLAKVFNLEMTDYSIGSVNNLPSKRANSLGLDTKKIEDCLKYKMPNLKECLLKLKEDYNDV